MAKGSYDKKIKEIYEDNLMTWVGYWRNNLHRFAEEYLGVKLHFFQKILLYLLGKSENLVMITARGMGKSFIVVLYACCYAILYPGSKIVIAAQSKAAASGIVNEKINELKNASPTLRQEIGDIKSHRDETLVNFLNGSYILTVVSGENARGKRSNVLIIDEYRMVDEKTVDEILIPTANVPRQTGFSTSSKYGESYLEPNRQVYMSSGWYKSHWSWSRFKDYFKRMLKDMPYTALSLSYQTAVLHGLLQQSTVDEIMTSSSFNPFSFDMEYRGKFVGQNGESYFNLEALNATRKVERVFIPPTDREYVENQALSNPKKLLNLPRIDGEIRLVGLDPAMAGSSYRSNDTSVFTCMRMIPDANDSFTRQVVYIESIQDAITADELAVRFKQLYYDFEANYAVLDVMGIGRPVYDAVATVTEDSKRDEEYPPWISINHKDLRDRVRTPAAKEILYTYKGSVTLNSEIAVELNNAIISGVLQLPKNEIEKREDLIEVKGAEFLAQPLEEQQRELYTYQQTSALVNELVMLEMEIGAGGNIRLKEVGNNTKDRYSSLAYTNHRAKELEVEIKKKKSANTDNLTDYNFGFGWRR